MDVTSAARIALSGVCLILNIIAMRLKSKLKQNITQSDQLNNFQGTVAPLRKRAGLLFY